MDRDSDMEEEKISPPHSECFIDESPNVFAKSPEYDFVSKLMEDFDSYKTYEETVLSILNAHSRERITNPADSDSF